ncbi:MAG: 23S rRNA (adenine(2503)-C(2))-methyltransferase RlmN [Phycisphaerae bacterium]
MEHLLNLTLDELTARLKALGLPHFCAKQVMEWVYVRRVTDFAAMSNISKLNRDLLAQNFVILEGQEVKHHVSADGTEKILIQWPDGGLTETVMIPAADEPNDEHGAVAPAKRRTACLSTQVGCPVKCAFCASGLDGWQANLTTGQVLEQALRLQARMPLEERLTNIVFMGMGEPLANFETTVGAVRGLMAPWAFAMGARRITVSSVGIPVQITKLASLKIPITLALSLHAPNDRLRRQIIPWAQNIHLAEIVAAGRGYFDTTGREVTIEYIMLDGLNNLPEHARELAALAKTMRANVNLIYYNEVPQLPFRRPTGKSAFAFQSELRAAGCNAHIRRSRGRDVAAACGQLARQEKVVSLGLPETGETAEIPPTERESESAND